MPFISHREPVSVPSVHNLTHNLDNLELPKKLQYMSLNLGRKPEYSEENPQAGEEYANSAHTG